MKKATIQLGTLTCPSCVRKIENAARSVDGVDRESVTVLFNSGKLKFDFDPGKTSADDVARAVEALGFEVVKTQVKD